MTRAKFIAFASVFFLGIGPVAAQTIPLNGNFQIVGENGSSVTLTAGSGVSVESAARYWTQGIAVPGSTITTQLLPSTHPTGGNMIRVVTNNGLYAPVSYGNGLFWAQGPATTISANTPLSFDIFVVSGAITGGLVQTSGAFLSFTAYTPTGSWQHVQQLNTGTSTGLAFENLVTNAGAEFYLANVSLGAPEPSALALCFPIVAAVGGGLSLRHRGRRKMRS